MAYVDLLTVIVAAIIFVIISSFWHSSFMFKKVLMKLKNNNLPKKPGRKKKLKPIRKIKYLYDFLICLVIAYVLSLLEILAGVVSFWDGVLFGFIIWLGFIGTFQMFQVVFDRKPFKLFIIENGLYLLNLMIIGGVLAG